MPSTVEIAPADSRVLHCVMGDKQEWDQAAKARVMSTEAEKHDGKVPEGNFARDAQAKADKREAAQKK